jgi:hypothetical protein
MFRLPFLYCASPQYEVLYIVASVISICSSGLLIWTQYYKLSLLFTDTVLSKRIHLIGVFGGCIIGFIGGSLVLTSSLYEYSLSHPLVANFTLNADQVIIVKTLERWVFLLSMFLNIGSESFMISLLASHGELTSPNRIFIVIILTAILSDLLALVGSVIYLYSSNLQVHPSTMILVNWFRVSPTINVWCQSYSTDIFKLVLKKKKDSLESSFSFGKLDEPTKIVKTLPG